MLVFVAVVVAAGLLAAGLFAGQVALLWAALAVSLAGAALLAFVLLRGRGRVAAGVEPGSAEVGALAPVYEPVVAEPVVAEPVVDEPVVDEPAGADEPVVDEPAALGEFAVVVVPTVDEPAVAAESVAVDERTPVGELAVESAPVVEPPRDLLVRVIPGRYRFHATDCRLLTGHSAERISLDEARDEGFTACTTCLPRRESAASVV